MPGSNPPARQQPGQSKGQGPLRIIAGQWRSRRLAVPAGAGLRPPPDRVRAPVFTWLAPEIR
ncbi:RsmD family RNA methyltransferase, partial [Pseudomonas fulva]|uniref:RsmD family RNA methyltransferase n=1 Tax=Pseudomonas fulva TaxID=47880 RepID=UPI0034D63598